MVCLSVCEFYQNSWLSSFTSLRTYFCSHLSYEPSIYLCGYIRNLKQWLIFHISANNKFIQWVKYLNIEINSNVITLEESIKFINNQEEDFNIGELWAFPLMIRISLILNLANIVHKMVVLQKQRLGAKDLANLN